MSRQVLTAPKAAQSLREARRWLLQPGSGTNVFRRWQALRLVPHRLPGHPYLGSQGREHPGYRQFVNSEYRVIYRVDPDAGDQATAGDVLVPQGFGPGQDVDAKL